MVGQVTGKSKETPDVRPGSNVSLVLKVDSLREVMDARSSSVYDVSGSEVILAQTDPRLLKSHIGRLIHVTYLVGRGPDAARFGFPGRIKELIDDYQLSRSMTAEAVYLTREDRPEVYNLRMFHRIEPPEDLQVMATVDGRSTNVLDLSIGGIKVSCATPYQFKPASMVKVGLVMEGQVFEIDGMIRRIWWRTGETTGRADLEFIAIEFVMPDERMKGLIGRTVREIERQIRYREMFC